MYYYLRCKSCCIFEHPFLKLCVQMFAQTSSKHSTQAECIVPDLRWLCIAPDLALAHCVWCACVHCALRLTWVHCVWEHCAGWVRCAWPDCSLERRGSSRYWWHSQQWRSQQQQSTNQAANLLFRQNCRLSQASSRDIWQWLVTICLAVTKCQKGRQGSYLHHHWSLHLLGIKSCIAGEPGRQRINIPAYVSLPTNLSQKAR